MLPLTGYADRFSVAPGQTIAFKVSSTAATPYQVRLVRLISGDPNPAGPGIKEEPVPAPFAPSYPSRVQPVPLGSYLRVPDAPAFGRLRSFTLVATIWPTLPDRGQQGIIARHDPARGAGFALFVDARGAGALVGNGRGGVHTVHVGKPFLARAWYRVWASYDAATRTLTVGQAPLAPRVRADDAGVAAAVLDGAPALDSGTPLLVAALGGAPVAGHYNGKIERPAVYDAALEPAKLAEPGGAPGRHLVALWDFARHTSSTRAVDVGPNGLDGELVNLPARAMMGSNWTGREMCWRHAPDEYGAIHFHDDDLYDCGWATDFTYTVPEGLRSGVYAVRLEAGDVEDMIPFFVRPPRGQRTADVCVLMPTFTYIVYANIARDVTNDEYRARVRAWGARPWTSDEHQEYGLSTYNFHHDGSGIAYSSRLRPILNLRSSFLAYVDPRGSGVRHLPADLYLLDWLEQMGHRYDVITDEDLHAEGLRAHRALQGRAEPDASRVPQHRDDGRADGVCRARRPPDVHRRERLLLARRLPPRAAGRARAATRRGRHPGVGRRARRVLHELRRAVRRPLAAQRAAAPEARPGSVSVAGSLRGLLLPSPPGGAGPPGRLDLRRRRRRDPRRLRSLRRRRGRLRAGSRRLPARTPPHAVVLASSEKHDLTKFVLVPEDVLSHVWTWPGDPPDKLIRADMVYFETPNNGAVFSVGSITFCGSLSHGGYRNNISRIVDNVLRRFATA